MYGELTLVAAALAFTTHIDTIKYTTHNSSKFGAGAQTAAPGPRSTLDPPRTPDPGMGIAASASMPLGVSGSICVGRSASSASSAAAEAASSPAATAAATVTWARGVRVRGMDCRRPWSWRTPARGVWDGSPVLEALHREGAQGGDTLGPSVEAQLLDGTVAGERVAKRPATGSARARVRKHAELGGALRVRARTGCSSADPWRSRRGRASPAGRRCS